VRSALLALGLALVSAAAAQAGTEITIETRKAGDAPDAKPQRSVVEAEGRKLRAEYGDGRHGAVWSGEDGVLQILDHRDKSVFRIDRATAREVLGARDGIRDGVPAGARESVDRWLGGGPPVKIELRGTGKSAQVGGVSCRLIDALRNGARLAEVCEGPSGALGVGPEALAPARELAAFLAEVGDLLPRSLGGEGLDALALVPQVKGVPLRVRAWPKDAVPTESRIVQAVAKPIPAGRFQAPPDYQPGLAVRIRD
jgi:hypothetical protein